MKKEIGIVGVDSGQILICDPCYIDSQWKHEEFDAGRSYLHIDTQIVLKYGRDFQRYDEQIQMFDRTMNDMIASDQVKELPPLPAHHNFSYNACCKKTLGNDHDGQLNYEHGHAGVGVVSSSGWGDGTYPVIADIDERSGRVKSITIVFIDDDENDG